MACVCLTDVPIFGKLAFFPGFSFYQNAFKGTVSTRNTAFIVQYMYIHKYIYTCKHMLSTYFCCGLIFGIFVFDCHQ